MKNNSYGYRRPERARAGVIVKTKAEPTPRLRTVVLATKEFIALPDHPSQRDTLRRAINASKNHLKSPVEAHRVVSVAEYNGKYFKADGHTRAYLWAEGKLDQPQTVMATIMRCETEQEMIDFYDTFDNRKASKSAPDAVAGAARLHGLELHSKYLSTYRFSSALRTIAAAEGVYHRFDTREMVARYADELRLLDGIEPEPTVFRSGMIAGALLLLRRHGERIVPFLDAVNRNIGTKAETTCDPIFAITTIVATTKNTTGMVASMDIAAKMVAAGERWIQGKVFNHNRKGVSLRAWNIQNYVEQIAKIEAAKAEQIGDGGTVLEGVKEIGVAPMSAASTETIGPATA